MSGALLTKLKEEHMDRQIFISASYYKQKYYANPQYEGLPAEIRNEMRVLCIMLAEKLHGIITLGFYPNGDVFLNVTPEEGDHEHDEIGAQLEIKDVEKENADTFKKMKLWYLMYQTNYGELFRETLTLFHTEKKSASEIVEILCSKYGEAVKDTIEEIIETIEDS